MGETSLSKKVGLFLGPSVALLMLLIGPPASLAESLVDAVQSGRLSIDILDPTSATGIDAEALATRAMIAWGAGALLVWMGIWWATEPIPIPVTSLLPLVVLPLLGASNVAAVGASYGSHIVILLLGGFIIALGIERWDLHKRIALYLISAVGTSPKALIAGFMLATAILSMWISNTATTLMMVPIALSAAAALNDKDGKFVTALLLGICYAASIGGVGTPIGTPTNLIVIDFLRRESDIGISFPEWMAFGLPAVVMLIPLAWFVVTHGLKTMPDGANAASEIGAQRQALGSMSLQEARIATVFGCVAMLWVLRLPLSNVLAGMGWDTPKSLGGQADAIIAIAGAIAVFLVPAGGEHKRALLSWEEAVKIPWGVLLLFGGGIALGVSLRATGTSVWIGDQLTVLSVLPTLLFVAAVVAMVIFLTELTSNVATMTTLAPILGSLAVAIGAAPTSLLAPAAVAASCAFMLPVATAPNAIIYASGKITVGQMMKHGLRLNLIAIVVITGIGLWLAPFVL
ncbi:MAG: SLC13 family permease [Pseudomonadota bacterium]